MKENGLNDKKTAPFSTLLANAMERAARASRVERATRWGARVLWAGGVGGGALAWRLGQDASTVGMNAAIVLSTALCVAVGFALKEKSGTRERRRSALLAARRLEKRLGKRAELFVAAVDFSEETPRDSFANAGSTSAVLRSATVETATREYAEIEATLDEAELFAVLTATSADRFRKIGEMRWLCVLGVLANVVIWGGAEIWGSWNEAQRPSVVAVESANDKTAINEGGNRENKENREKEEEEKIAEKTKPEENSAAIEPTSGTVDEELSLSALELLISELAQNAEIAETLAAELERAVAEEERENEKGAPSNSETLFLQLARELSGNLTRPGTGLVAQTRRLSAAAERERRALETRWVKMGELNALGKKEKNGEINKAASPENGVGELTRITGKEIAVFLTAARLTEWETKLTTAGGVGDWAALELSGALRSDSTTERKRILAEAATRVGEWGRTLRREETAARILSESWRFDATSSQRATLIKRAEEENRALLTRFAGRFNVDFNAPNENDKELEEAKRRFDALWKETETAEKDCVAIVERLRERLQDESAQDFIAFVCQGDVVWQEIASRDAESDEAAWQLLNDMTSQSETRRTKIGEDVENNRFGSAATRLENAVSLIPVVEWKKEDDELLNVEIVGISGEAAKKTESGDSQEERRFSALAALLTFGVGSKTTLNLESQDELKEDVARLLKSAPNGALMEKEATAKDRKDEEATFDNEVEASQDSTAQKGKSGEEGRTLAAENKTEDKVNIGNATTLGGVLDVERGNGSVASGEETGGENGAIATGGVGDGAKNGSETAENQAFNGELPAEARRRIKGTSAPEILPEYAEKIRLYRRRILEERR